MKNKVQGILTVLKYAWCLIFLSIFSPVLTNAQNCGCTHSLVPAKGTITFDGNLQTPKVKAGDVICIPTGTRTRIIIKNIVGTAANPVIIQNCGGQAIISDAGTTASPISIVSSKYFKFTGSGDPATLYGIKVTGGSNGISFGGSSSNFEVDHVEVSNCGFAGIMAKTDPKCADPMSWRENFTMYDVAIHHNYVHDVQGEGFYIGNSFYNSIGPGTDTCGGKLAHGINGLDVYRNIVKRTGCEGIQVGSAPKNCKIHDNTVDTTGLNPFANFQNNGLQIGGGTGGMLYNNWMNYCPGNGISCLGIGDNLIFNNIILNSGADTAALGIGIFMDEQSTADTLLGKGMKFINNTIINPRGNGIRVYTDRLPMSYILNNIIVQYGTNPEYLRKLNSSVNLTIQGNVFRNKLSDLMFMDTVKRDYRLKAGSPAIGVGVNASSHGVTFDFNNNLRTTPYDAGAFAYNPIMSISEKLGIEELAATFFVYPNPMNLNAEELNFKFFLDEAAEVGIQSFDMQGKLQSELSTSYYKAGWNDVKVSKSYQGQAKGAMVFKLIKNGTIQDSQIVMMK